GNDCLFSRTAHKAVQVGSNCYAGAGANEDAVFCDTIDSRFAAGRIRTINDFGIDRRFDRFKHSFTRAFGGQINRTSAVEIQVNTRFASGDEGENYHLHIAAGQVMGREVIDGNIESGFDGGDTAVNDQPDRDPAQAQGNQFGKSDTRTREESSNPDAKEVDHD